MNENSSPTLEQQRGLDAYESLIRENPDGFIGTLLHFAVARSDDQLLGYALDHGLRQHGNINQRDPIGRLPIDVALQKEHVPCIEKLVTRGADADLSNFLKSLARRNRMSTIGRFLESKNLENHVSFSVLLTMFETTLSSGSIEATKIIVSSQRFRTAVSVGGEEYLQSLAATLLLGNQNAWRKHKEHLESVLDTLLSLGLNLEQRWPADSPSQESWLHVMADSPYVHSIQSIIDRGANVDALDSQCRTPIMRAVARAEVREDRLSTYDQINKIVDILLRYNASLDAGKSVWSMKTSNGFWLLFEKLVLSVPWISHVDEGGLTLLHYAVDESNQDEIDLLLPKCSLILNHCSLIYGTALSIACRKQDWNTAVKLVRTGAQCSYIDLKAMLNSPKDQRPHLLETLKYTPFLLQEIDATAEEVQQWLSLLTQDVLLDCNQISDLQTLDRLSKWLPSWLKNGQDVAEALTMRTRYLPAACQLEACKILLKNGTNPNAYTNDARPRTLIEYAVKHLLFDCAATLLEAGADPNQSRSSKTLVLDRALKIATRGPFESRCAAAEFADRLRQWGARQEKSESRLGPTVIMPLQQPSPASSTTSQSSHGTLVLISRQLTLTPESPPKDAISQPALGQNALHRAISKQDSQAVYRALSSGIDPNIPTPITNDYPVAMAVKEGLSSILHMLLSGYFRHMFPTPSPNGTICGRTYETNPHGAERPECSWTGGLTNLTTSSCLPEESFTYLMAAVMKGSVSCVRVLLENGADVNVRAHGYRTVLHHLISLQPQGYVEMAEMISRYGADVFAEEEMHYFTPLHMAVQRQDKKLLEALLASSAFAAEYGYRTRDTRHFTCGWSPLDLAKQLQFDDGIRLFHRAWESARAGRW